MSGPVWLAIALLAGAADTATPAPSGREHGRQVFDRWCAPCHAPGPGHPGTQSLDVKYGGKLPAPLEARSDLTPDITRYFVRHGVALMPFFRETEISEAELKDLADYLAKARPAKRR